MDPGFRSPLVDLFRRGEAARDVRMLAARGLLAPRAQEQIALLVLLADDEDAEIATEANATMARLPVPALAAFLSQPDVPAVLRDFFASRGIQPADAPAPVDAEPLLDDCSPVGDSHGDPERVEGSELPALQEPAGEDDQTRVLSGLAIADRLKLAMKGTREQRAQLIRDSNKIVATAVLSSPKLTDSEVEAFCKMGNVSEDVLRIIGTNRAWLKNYGVILGLTRNPKTPLGLSMQMMHRLTEKDVKMLTVDRNVPEALRLAARRLLVKAKHG
jgi:hypothetical protein